MYVIVNIIKFKRTQGLNYLSFGEQRFFVVIMLILHVWFPSDGEGYCWEGRREGGIMCCPFLQQYPAEKS